MKLKIYALFISLILLNNSACACKWDNKFISNKSKVLSNTDIEKINHFMLVPFIIKKIGHAKRDTGTETHVLEWNTDNGKIFFVKTNTACGKPHMVGLR